MHILLLEDLPEIRQWLKGVVTQVFPNALVSESARVHDALEQITAVRFDLALIDLGLPDGSGVDVVEALRESQPDAQSVVVTIHDDDDHLFPALQAGAFGYVLKEQSRDLLAEQLQRITQGEPPLSPSIASLRAALAATAAQPMNRPARNDWPVPKRTSRARSSSPLARPAARAAVPRTSSVTLSPRTLLGDGRGRRRPRRDRSVAWCRSRVWTADRRSGPVSPRAYRGRITLRGAASQRHDSRRPGTAGRWPVREGRPAALSRRCKRRPGP